MSDSPRARRLADRIKVIVAQTLEHRVKDPRLGFITVTEVRMTGDLQHATVFYTVLGTQEEQAATAAALDSARGKLRSEVGRGIDVRLTPSLEFVLDAVPENATVIEDLLRRAREHDAQVAQLAAHGRYAGEPDPYRHPAEPVDHDPDADDDLTEPGEDRDGPAR